MDRLPVIVYIDGFPENSQKMMQEIRNTIFENPPDAIESIAYGMPAYKYKKKPLVYFAAYKQHIGLYSLPKAHAAFKEKLSGYKQGKGSVQFPLDQPLPLVLIKEMLLFRMNEIDMKTKK